MNEIITKVTVKDAIESRYLCDIAVVRGGHGGLNKNISWTHVLEIRDLIKESIDPGGMILTTGIGFTDKETTVRFVKELIEENAVALCIETALYYHIIDEEIIELANKNDFVLAEIPVISRFIDISKGINTIILSMESRIFNNADNYDSKLLKIETVGNLSDGIKYTAKYLNINVAYLPTDKSAVYSSDDFIKSCDRELNTCKKELADGLPPIFGPVSKLVRTVFDVLPIIGPV